MKMKYKIYPERNLLVDIIYGNANLQDLEKLFVQEISNENFKSVNKVLSNILHTKFNVTVADLEKFIHLMIGPTPATGFRWAILTDDPFQTALSFLIKEETYFKNIVGVFSTLEACTAFLNISFDEKDFNEDGYLTIE